MASWFLSPTNLNSAEYQVLPSIKTLQDGLTLVFSLVQAWFFFKKGPSCYGSKHYKVKCRDGNIATTKKVSLNTEKISFSLLSNSRAFMFISSCWV